MMKCDMCYDRTSAGKKPMCATVCPSQALFFGTREELATLRPQSRPSNVFRFGEQTITTRVNVLLPRGPERPPHLDVTAAMDRQPQRRALRLAVHNTQLDTLDPFAEVEV
jgi:Fe-S-cluster-containing dehydrogenase component